MFEEKSGRQKVNEVRKVKEDRKVRKSKKSGIQID
jgi:hypothetical protein